MTELESKVSHLKMINDYSGKLAAEQERNSNNQSDEYDDDDDNSEEEPMEEQVKYSPKVTKCHFDNIGDCRNSPSKCSFYHPRKLANSAYIS